MPKINKGTRSFYCDFINPNIEYKTVFLFSIKYFSFTVSGVVRIIFIKSGIIEKKFCTPYTHLDCPRAHTT